MHLKRDDQRQWCVCVWCVVCFCEQRCAGGCDGCVWRHVENRIRLMLVVYVLVYVLGYVLGYEEVFFF